MFLIGVPIAFCLRKFSKQRRTGLAEVLPFSRWNDRNL
jgi:hypothetical protein